MNEPLTTDLSPTGVLTLLLSGDLTDARLEALQHGIAAAEERIRQLSQERAGTIRVMLDMTQFTGTYDVRAMEAMTRFARDNAPYIHRTAGFGGPTTGTFAGEIVTQLANRDNIKFFPDEQSALVWLMG